MLGAEYLQDAECFGQAMQLVDHQSCRTGAMLGLVAQQSVVHRRLRKAVGQWRRKKVGTHTAKIVGVTQREKLDVVAMVLQVVGPNGAYVGWQHPYAELLDESRNISGLSF